MNENDNKAVHNDGEFYDDDGDRYISVEQSIIGSCKEIKEMIAGRKPKRTWVELESKMKQWVEEVEQEEREAEKFRRQKARI